jgi:hypothetical protein
MERSQDDERKKLVLTWLVGIAAVVITARYMYCGNVMFLWIWVHFKTIRFSGKGRYFLGGIASATLSAAIAFAVYRLVAPVFYIQYAVFVTASAAFMMVPALVANWFYQRARKSEGSNRFEEK